jgi:hypothetical protein
MSIAVAVKHLIAAGVTGDDLVAAIAEMEAAMAPAQSTLTARQARNARYYQNRKERLKASESDLNRLNASYSDVKVSPSLSPKEKSPPITPSKEITPISTPSKNARDARSLAVQAAFDAFWRRWPHKVGKPAAEKAFAKVSGEIEAILIGIDRYIRDKPPDRPWLNPATFLNQRRWEDAPAETFQASRQEPAKKISAVTQAIMNLEAQIHETQTTRDRQALRQIPVNGELIPGGFGLEDPGLPGNLKRFHG